MRKGTRLERLERREGEAWWERCSQREWEARVKGLAGHVTDCGFNSEWSGSYWGVSVNKCQVLTHTFKEFLQLLHGEQKRRDKSRSKKEN